MKLKVLCEDPLVEACCSGFHICLYYDTHSCDWSWRA